MPTLPTNPHYIGDSGHVNDHNLIAAALVLLPPIGSVTAYAGSTAPSSWLFCYGQAISRTTYASLYAVLGTSYGVGDGSTTFNLPDLRGRTVAGFDNMGGTDAGRLDWANTPNTAGGSQTHTLSTTELPSHNHTQDPHSHGPGTLQSTYPTSSIGESSGMYHRTNAGDLARGDNTNNNGAWVSNLVTGKVTGTTTATNQATGGGGAHNNMQPTMLLNWIIRAT